MSQSSAQFQFLKRVKLIQNISSYVNLKDSKWIVICLHQHFGMTLDFIGMCEKFIAEKASIIVPDYYFNIPDQVLEEQDPLSSIQTLNLDDVCHAIRVALNFAKQIQKTPIIIGFSTSSAIGLKLMEEIDSVQFGMFFYGYPILEHVNPEKIKSPVVIFHANKDKSKYISDSQMLTKAEQVYRGFSHIKIQKLDSHHGFMNYSHSNFDQESFSYCKKIFQNYLKQSQPGIKPKGQQKEKQKEKQIQKEEKPKDSEQGGCNIF